MNKRKGKYRFNIIDVLLTAVIVLSIFAIAFLVYRSGKQEDDLDSMKNVKIVYTVENKEIDDILRGKIDIGNSLYSIDGKSKLGEVVDVEYSSSEYEYVDPENNQTVSAVLPGRLDMRVVVSAEAKVDENGIYYINGIRMNEGNEFEARFPSYTGKCVCVSVSEVNE